MRKISTIEKLLFASCIGIWGIVLERAAEARIIGPDSVTNKYSTDLWCVGGRVAGTGPSTLSATEVCVDSTGDIVPTTANSTTQNLGNGSYFWNAVYQNVQYVSKYTNSFANGVTTAASGPGIAGTTCGNVPNVTITGTNVAMRLKIGTAAPTNCTIVLNPAYVNTPMCLAVIENSGLTAAHISLPTSVQFNTTIPANSTVDIQCIGIGS